MDEKMIRALLSRIPALVGSMGALVGGIAMLIDDYRDLGKVDRPHHWIWGLLSFLAGITGIGLTVLDFTAKLPPKLREKPLPKLKEKPSLLEGLPKEFLEALR